MNELDIPSHVDDQMQIFFWEMDEFIPSVAIISLFIIMWNQALIGILLAFVFTIVFSRFKSASLQGVLFHIVWWSGAFSMNKKFDSGLNRELTK
jgi:conjugal transfer pilus assembly protein TraL